MCFYSVTKNALYVSDYDANTNYYHYNCTTGASTVAKAIVSPASTNPKAGELFPLYWHTTNTAKSPTFSNKPIFVEGVQVQTTNQGILAKGCYMAYFDATGLHLTQQGLPSEFLDTLPYLKEHQSLANYVLTTDSRLSDARTPVAHTHTKSQITDFPTIPTVPTNVSAFNNDAGYLTSLGDPYTETDIDNMWQYANLYYWEDSNTSGGDVPVIGGGDDGPIIIEPLL